MKTATQILREHGIEVMELDDDFNTALLHSMDEYATQFKDKTVTELNERNSVDEAKKFCACNIDRSKVIRYEEHGLRCSTCNLPIANF